LRLSTTIVVFIGIIFRSEEGAQITAPLVIEGKSQKPLFPTNNLDRTPAICAALLQPEKPLDAEPSPKPFAKGQVPACWPR
jgi:hypothetical protein